MLNDEFTAIDSGPPSLKIDSSESMKRTNLKKRKIDKVDDSFIEFLGDVKGILTTSSENRPAAVSFMQIASEKLNKLPNVVRNHLELEILGLINSKLNDYDLN